tara:strand:- start:132316 stop:133272 length:957 start_codon:yes stop_codon:yes gene_type:complete
MHTPQPEFVAPIRRIRAQDAERLSARISHWQEAPPAPRPPATAPEEGHGAALCNGLPEVSAAALSAAGLRHGIQTHGAVIVRDLVPASLHPALRDLIDRVITACASPGDRHDCYFDPPDILRQKMPGGELGRSRAFHRDSGSAMCAEAPCVAESLLELYGSLGLKALFTDYLGEAPCLSVKKWVLRKTRLPVHQAGWHQDGAFMGEYINSINLWIPLTRCGGETGAPGMDVVPARLQRIVSADGALFDWSVSPESVSSHFPRTPPVAPVFNPGDALLFDHLFLHRTQYRTDFQRPRYAIETWFFGESAAPLNQVPIRW